LEADGREERGVGRRTTVGAGGVLAHGGLGSGWAFWGWEDMVWECILGLWGLFEVVGLE